MHLLLVSHLQEWYAPGWCSGTQCRSMVGWKLYSKLQIYVLHCLLKFHLDVCDAQNWLYTGEGLESPKKCTFGMFIRDHLDWSYPRWEDPPWIWAASSPRLPSWTEPKREMSWAPALISLCFLTVNSMWPAASHSCHHVFPGRLVMSNCECKETFPSLFCHSN